MSAGEIWVLAVLAVLAGLIWFMGAVILGLTHNFPMMGMHIAIGCMNIGVSV